MNEELQKAKNYALKLITFRFRSAHEIKTRLEDKGFSEEVIIKTLNFLREYNFVDDLKFAQLWAENRKALKPLGPYRLKQELKQKGIKDNIIEAVLLEITPETELNMALQTALKKTNKVAIKKEKLTAFLARRGFSSSIIRRTLELLPRERLEDMVKS